MEILIDLKACFYILVETGFMCAQLDVSVCVWVVYVDYDDYDCKKGGVFHGDTSLPEHCIYKHADRR